MTPTERLQLAQLERRVMRVASTIAMKFNALDEGICMCAYCVDHRALTTAMNTLARAMIAAGLGDGPLGATNQPPAQDDTRPTTGLFGPPREPKIEN